MALNKLKVLLGFEDELINEKYKNQTNFTTNKMGGIPDLPANIKLDTQKCSLCGLPQPLVLQLYAPLDNSIYHRTLYLFACINPNCWNQSESWTCLRIQSQEKIADDVSSQHLQQQQQSPKCSATDWCADADNWNDDSDDNATNNNEENGNLINIDKISDEDDESCSFEESIRLGNLKVDDRNANNGALGGAVGRLCSPLATAEIEGDEGEVISIDTPTYPQHDLCALLQEVTPLPPDIFQNSKCDLNKVNTFEFVPYFISVWEESTNCHAGDGHVKELLQEYQMHNENNEMNLSPDSGGGASAQGNETNLEKYEKSNPAHGDKMFYDFSSRIQMNPGQILRYIRDIEPPLLLYPLKEYPQKCHYCQGELIFEFQVLPTIIPKLRLMSDIRNSNRLEFGTVLIATCRKSCWSTDATSPRNEIVILQKEI